MSEFSRRVGSKAPTTKSKSTRGRTVLPRALTLHILPFLTILPAISGLLVGNSGRTIGSVVAFIALFAAARTMRSGLEAEEAYDSRRVAKAPRPLKTYAHALVALGVLILAFVAARESLGMTLVYAILAGLGSVLAYGLDPRQEKAVDPKLAARAGIDTQAVVDALNEAEGKLFAIQQDANNLANRELTSRLEKIVESGRRVLDQIEKDPSDIRRARRFLVTYLDGTQNVVATYLAQQDDVASTPLAENFRHVLDTVEKVFAEQEEVLKRNESLDLEVQIDVLRTQLEREGVA